MSKRIIYLLSLLMALSLMFSNCKENGLDDILGTTPENEPNNGFDNSPETDTGLVEDEAWLNENSDKPIKNEQIPYLQTKADVAYFRNPVVVVMDKSDIVVFAEKRYKTSGSENDVGVTGSAAVDIVYVSSQNSGRSWNIPKIVGRSSESTGGTDAVASPVVFKIDDKTVVVVASAGAGLSRISALYNSRDPKSELKYTIGTYNNGIFTWTKQWEDMTAPVKAATENVSVSGNAKSYKYHQFGTLAARGFVNNGKDLYLAVTLVDQGRSGNYANNAFGNVMVKGTYNSSSVDWQVIDNTAIGFSTILDGRSGYLESVAVGLKNSEVYYLAGGSSFYGSSTGVHIGEGTQGKQPTASGQVDGSEGSFSYLEVLNWKGLETYNPANYDMSNGTKLRLFSHVIGYNNTITIRALDDNEFKQKAGTTGYKVQGYPTDNTILAKSSSMDILGDGTIVMVAEQGRKEKEYYIVFKRFTQKFLAMKLGFN